MSQSEPRHSWRAHRRVEPVRHLHRGSLRHDLPEARRWAQQQAARPSMLGLQPAAQRQKQFPV